MAPEQTMLSAERWLPKNLDLDLDPDGVGAVRLRTEDRNRTQPFLLLHGGAGPASVVPFGDLLAARDFARVLTPTHPGFDGTPRPDTLATVGDLARTYVAALDRLDLWDVTVIGNSFGGRVAAEIALLGSPRVSGAVIVDAVGADIPGEEVPDVRTLAPQELIARSFYDPARMTQGPAPSPDLVKANLDAMYTYCGQQMSDPTLLPRLRDLELPVQIVWGAADRMVTTAHGRAWADAVPGASFDVIDHAGHLPQLEAPEQLLGLINDLGDDK